MVSMVNQLRVALPQKFVSGDWALNVINLSAVLHQYYPHKLTG